MGSQGLTLVHFNFNGFGLSQFPVALTQLVALKCLRATRNEFAQLPAAITALSRLMELRLGRMMSGEDPHWDVACIARICASPGVIQVYGCCLMLRFSSDFIFHRSMGCEEVTRVQRSDIA